MLRSFLAIVAGYLTIALGVTSTLAILLFIALDGFPEPGPWRGPGWVLWAELVCGLAAAGLGGYVCGLVARRRPLVHGLVLAAIVAVLGFVSMSVEQGLKPLWSTIALAIIGPLGVVLGAALRARHVQRLR